MRQRARVREKKSYHCGKKATIYKKERKSTKKEREKGTMKEREQEKGTITLKN